MDAMLENREIVIGYRKYTGSDHFRIHTAAIRRERKSAQMVHRGILH